MLLFHTLDVDASENVTAVGDSHTNVSHGFVLFKYNNYALQELEESQVNFPPTVTEQTVSGNKMFLKV